MPDETVGDLLLFTRVLTSQLEIWRAICGSGEASSGGPGPSFIIR